MKKDTFYITTALPYVNANPHMGHALEFIRADIIARYKRNIGKEVFFNIGTDEHGKKIWNKAAEAGQDVQEYVDYYASRFEELAEKLNLSHTNFIRTTSKNHIAAVQKFWRLCHSKGDIYKKDYEMKYCVGCELEKTDSDLDDGHCPEHPTLKLEIIKEENYFFRFSRYQDTLLALYEENPNFVLPEHRLNEIKSFVKRGLQDFSISRLKDKMPWGIPVPDDDKHIIYVWFDALVNYIAAIGWPDDMEKFEKWWPVVQIAGKDNLRQQSAMWQAMLLSAGIPPSKQILINGFITSNGQKMSKSLGDVVDPVKIIDEYGIDALRYYIARELNGFEDGDFTEEKFIESYNANLANGLGNLVSRIMKMSETHLQEPVDVETYTRPEEYCELLDSYAIQKAADFVWEKVSSLDANIQKTQPFKLAQKEPKKAVGMMKELVRELYKISVLVEPFMPETSEKIQYAIEKNKKPNSIFKRIQREPARQ